jgi:hypothetical protein
VLGPLQSLTCSRFVAQHGQQERNPGMLYQRCLLSSLETRHCIHMAQLTHEITGDELSVAARCEA